MNNSNNILSVFDSMWAISPSAYHEYAALFANIISNSANASYRLDKSITSSIQYIVTENGERIPREEQTPPGSIGVVNLVGPMVKNGNWWFWGADELVQMLDAFDQNPNIIGSYIKGDSGGGSVKAVSPYYDFYARKTKPCGMLADTCASAALWVGAGADFIMAENNISAQFGSVGVMAHLMSYAKWYEKIGITEHIINSDHSEDKNKAFELALKGDYEQIKKEHLNPLAIKFQEDLKSNLPKLDLSVPGIITGKMFYAEEALKHGIIDEIGNEQRAIEKIIELAAVQNFNN